MAVTDAVKLDIYNRALLRLGSRKLSSLTENREPRRVLDDLWGSADAVVSDVLERGDWNFATRAAQIDYTASIEPDFGFRRAFVKPSDLKRVTSLAADEYFRQPLTADYYSDEAEYWYADIDTIFVRYISDDDAFGLNDAAWSRDFINYLSAYLAYDACERITNSQSRQAKLEREMTKLLKIAKSNDSLGEGVKFPPVGSWIRARHGARRYRGE